MHANGFHPERKPKYYFIQAREEMLSFISPSARRILDVGCGAGNFGALVKSHTGGEVWGIEISAQEGAEARTKLDKLIVGDIEKDGLGLPQSYFDCIVFNDVLEHLYNPWVVLKSWKSFLRDGGNIVASIPNVRYFPHISHLLRNKRWDYEDDGILDRTHLRFFTERTIRDMFHDCGYEIITLEGIHAVRFSWKMNLLNWVFRKSLDDMKYRQFAVVARKIDGAGNIECKHGQSTFTPVRK